MRFNQTIDNKRSSPALSCIEREKERRTEPRIPQPGKLVVVYLATTVEVHNKSSGGICLKLPLEAKLEIGDTCAIPDEGFNRVGRVRWTSQSGAHRIAGFSWVDLETPTSNSLDIMPSDD